uniref:G-protein coupled receptors family 1 profile domain-containing protein n=1 Tax=Chaetoceros debilis TaxID=122233 RepID=A0A7S3VFZ5_9STRA
MSIIMNTLTHNLLANFQYHFPYDHRSIPGLQQKDTRRLSFQGGLGPARPSFCPVTGLDSTNSSTFLNPYLQAGYICSSDDEGTRNSTTAVRQQIITYVDGSYIDLNCTDDGNGGNVTLESLSCLDADSFYRHEADTDDLEMLASWWSPNCCFATDDIRNFWWDTLQEYRESFFGRISIILIGVLGIISIICSSTFIWMLRRSHDGLSTTMNKVLLGLCVSDIMYSCNFLHFGMFVPKELDYWSWNARGNMATCYIAGFFNVAGGALGPFYNASLVSLVMFDVF